MHHYIWKRKNWSSFVWDEKTLLPVISRVRLKQGKLIQKINALETEDFSRAQAEVLIQETLRTAQIEGEIYDPATVRSSVNRKLGLSYAGLPESKRNIDGLVEMLIDATSGYDRKLDLDRLLSWQAGLFPTGYSGLRKIKVGEFRDDQNGPMQVISGPIGREKVHFQAPPAKIIPQELKHFLRWWEQSKNHTEGILRAGIAHFYFVTIHPFEDGNGRIARVLADMALAQDDKLIKRYYSLSEQILIERKNYYQILKKTQQGDSDLTEWLAWFLDCFERALKNSEVLLKIIFQKTEFWRKYQHVLINSRQKKILNKMLDFGQGHFKGGLTTRKYVSMGKVSRATAYREISDLVAKGMLKQMPGSGRSVSYDVSW